jgi:hypothetical protein
LGANIPLDLSKPDTKDNLNSLENPFLLSEEKEFKDND